MKVSLAWLAEWVDVGSDAAALAQRLTMAGLEVEGSAPAAGAFTQVVVGEVLAVARHPDADKLTVCSVRGAGSETLQVVCGAPNVRAGLKAPFASVGATLPGGLAIKRARLRGVESQGMLCSARELGLGEAADGLLELPQELPTGQDLRTALALEDTILEVNLTPNRGDALSMLGLARELAAVLRQPLRLPALAAVPADSAATFPVRLEAPRACAKFAGRVLRGLNPSAATPLWMRERLRRAGLRSLGPLVDVTNYVMLELGQPMHAYDLRRLSDYMAVRHARAGERLVLLDGRSVALEPDVLVIADATGPLALAGIMGGEKSGIAPDTVDVFLEVAWFAPEAIAGRARRYGLLTDAAQRFERGVDPAGQERALERASALLLAIAGGRAGPTVVEAAPEHLPAAKPIALRVRFLERLLGVAVPAAQVASILGALGMDVRATSEGWTVTAPSWRFDITREADLVEEVARLYGYNEIPAIDAAMPQRAAAVPEGRIAAERLIERLIERGYYEAITLSFVDPVLQRRLFPDVPALALANPISAELAEMRVSLWPGLLKALIDNVHRQQERVRLVECAARFLPGAGVGADVTEVESIAGIACGSTLPEQWGAPRARVDFHDVKADVEALLAASGAPGDFRFVAGQLSCLHPGRSARIYRGTAPCGWLGELHPELVRGLELTVAPQLFELDLNITCDAQLPAAKEISRFPAVRRDLAVVVAEATTFNELRESVTVAASSLLRELTVFDVYRGQGIDSGRKSVALGLILQDKSKTLTDADVDAVMAAVSARLQQDLGATLRD